MRQGPSNKADPPGPGALSGAETRGFERRVDIRTRSIWHQQQLLSQAEAIAHLGSWRWAVKADKFEGSDEIYRIFGVSKPQTPPSIEALLSLVHPEDVSSLRVTLDLSIKDKQNFTIQFRVERDTGELRYCWVEGRPELGDDREVRNLVGICHDITERVLAEMAANESNERYRQLVENSPDGVIVTVDDKIVFANSAALRIIGAKSRSEVLGKAAREYVHPDDVPLVLERRQKLWETGTVAPSEIRVVRRDGSILDVEVRGSIFTHQGRLAMQILVRDVTELKAMREQLVQSQKMEAVGQLTGGVAHDFNNLLSIVIGNLDLLETMLADQPRAQELARSALKASLRGADLTRQLLAFSRRQKLDPQPIQLNEIATSISALIQRSMGEDIQIDFDLESGLWTAEADPSQLESAILNLTINSRDAMPGGGRVIIATKNTPVAEAGAADQGLLPGDYVALSVSDTGHGIAPDILPHVFEPFFTTKEVGKGTGLGLSMVYGFAKQSGGLVKIETQLGHGTTVTLVLPRAKRDPVSARQLEHSDPIVLPNNETILLVEDNAEVRKMVARQLRLFGFQLREAGDAKSALKLLDLEPAIDILFTDIVMPGTMNGVDLAAEARNRRPEIKVLFTSGFAAIGAQIGPRLPPGARFLKKPYRSFELLQALSDVLGTAPSGGPITGSDANGPSRREGESRS